MADNPNNLDFDADWRFGFNVKSGQKACVGYLLKWSGCGGLNLQSDIEVWNPYSTTGQRIVSGPKVTCIGLLEKFRFEGGETDPIRIRAYVSKGTASDIRAKLARPLTNTKLTLSWYLIDFDEEDKVWYEASFVKTPTDGAEVNLDTAGGNLQIFIDKEPKRIMETLDISVYGFEFQVVPADGKTAMLEFATGSARRLVRQWGESSE